MTKYYLFLYSSVVEPGHSYIELLVEVHINTYLVVLSGVRGLLLRYFHDLYVLYVFEPDPRSLVVLFLFLFFLGPPDGEECVEYENARLSSRLSFLSLYLVASMSSLLFCPNRDVA